jgi:hypothetical protein
VREETLTVFYSPEEPGLPLRHTQRCLRTERWKLTWYPQIGRYQLFDLRNDPLELSDLLVDWRRRRRQAVESSDRHWRKDAWAARDARPQLKQAEVEAAVEDLYGRLLAQMERQRDPLVSLQPPPYPLGSQ